MTSRRRLTCHCVAVELAVVLADPIDHARRCDCSYCRRRGSAVVSVKVGDLKVIKGHDALTLYRFNTGTAKHYFCSICGINTHHKRRSNPNEFGVNALALEGVKPDDIGPAPFYDGVNHPSDT